MTVTEAEKVINEAKSVKYGTVDCMYEGLTILKKYHTDEIFNYNFEHDQAYVGAVDFEEYVSVMSDADVERMGQLGWFESADSWSHSN